MKTVSRYECELCHMTYETEEECTACETSHRTTEKISETVYHKGGRYPTVLKVLMSDGAYAKYAFINDQLIKAPGEEAIRYGSNAVPPQVSVG